MFGIIAHVDIDAEAVLERGDDRRDQPVAPAADGLDLAVDLDLARKDAGAVRRAAFLVVDQLEVLRYIEPVGLAEHAPDVGGLQFAAQFIGQFLHVAAEVRLHLLGQLEALVLFEHPGKAALARLRVDADHRFVAAAKVGRIDRQVGHGPEFVVALFLRGEALLDRVLMTARKRREHQFATIGVARVDRQLVAVFDRLDDFVDVREIEAGVDALRVEIEAHGHEATVAGALAIAEQATFDAVRARHQAEFGGGDAGAAIVVGVQADHRAVATRQVAAEILDLVGIDVRGRGFDRGRQVEDDRLFDRGLENFHHRFAAFDAEIDFGGGEGLRAIFEVPVGLREARGLIAQEGGASARDFLDLGLFHAEHDLAPQRRHGVVDVDDRLLGTREAFEAGADEVFARLREYLHEHVIGDLALIDEAADEIVLGGARAGEADLDFLDADLEQQVEEAGLLVRVHRIDQRLVAIAHVGRQPARGLVDHAAGPLAIGQVDLRERAILDRRVLQHGHGSANSSWKWMRMVWSVTPGRRARQWDRRVSSRPRAGKSQGKVQPGSHAPSLW